jgi:selenocysteine-specific elongation factor
VGGGEILDVDPMLPASRARPDRDVDRVVAERGWVDVDELRRLTGVAQEPRGGNWVVAEEALTETIESVRARIEQAGPLGLDSASLDERERAVVDVIEGASIASGRITMGEPVDPLADHPWVAALEADLFSPPGPDGVNRGEVRELVRRGSVVENGGVYFAATAITEASHRLARLLADQPAGFTVAEARDLLDTTRKFVLPLLAHLDQTGVTRRRDDLRIAGPRLPAPS